MAVRINLEDLDKETRFQVELQIALRKNASRIMEHYEDRKRFEDYIRQREEKIALILGVNGDFNIYSGNVAIFP
ncbi:MAG: hypothetical protein AAE983_04420 [Thermoplasmataceae archaeon]